MHIQRTYDPHPDLLELRGLERPACSNTLVPRGSHHISSLWSPVVATGGNRSQMGSAPKRLKRAQTVAVGCDQLRSGAHGKPEVDLHPRREGDLHSAKEEVDLSVEAPNPRKPEGSQGLDADDHDNHAARWSSTRTTAGSPLEVISGRSSW